MIEQKNIPEFKTREEFYEYAAANGISLDLNEAYKASVDSLLPVFKAAKEMGEYISCNEDYFKSGRSLSRLYHMAIVSKIVQDINESCGTIEEKTKCIRRARIYDENNFYVKDNKCTKAGWLIKRKKVADFMKVIDIAYDDGFAKLYMSAVQEDVYPLYSYSESPKCSVNGNILNWEKMKSSKVFKAVSIPMINEEVQMLNRLHGEPNNSYKYLSQAGERIQVKINNFCDMKNMQLMQSMQQEKGRKV